MNEFQKFLLAMQNSISGFMNTSSVVQQNDTPAVALANNTLATNTAIEKPEDIAKKNEEQENAIQKRIQDAVSAERNRLKEIDEMPSGISEELVNAAKYGDKPCDAKELAFQAFKKQQEDNAKKLDNLKTDADKSGANSVEGSQSAPDSTPESEKIAEAKAFAQQRKERKQNRK